MPSEAAHLHFSKTTSDRSIRMPSDGLHYFAIFHGFANLWS
jgi:hypothetical protein